jgi:hypothetical protein
VVVVVFLVVRFVFPVVVRMMAGVMCPLTAMVTATTVVVSVRIMAVSRMMCPLGVWVAPTSVAAITVVVSVSPAISGIKPGERRMTILVPAPLFEV